MPRPVTEATRDIPEFEAYVLDNGRVRAVHLTDRGVVIEADSWERLAHLCTVVRVRRTCFEVTR